MVSRRRRAIRIKRAEWGVRNMLAKGVGSVGVGVNVSIGDKRVRVKKVKLNITIGVLKEMSWLGQIAKK